MGAASIIRLQFSQRKLAASVTNIPGMMTYKPRTILAWIHECGKLGGYLKRGGRGVSEWERVLSEEELELERLNYLKSQKRVLVNKVREYVDNVLLTGEGW